MRVLLCIVFMSGFASFAHAADPDALTGTINGKVVGADGAGLADVSVKLYLAKEQKKIAFADVPEMKPEQEDKTGKDGTFKFENVVPGEYTIIAGDMRGLGRSPASV